MNRSIYIALYALVATFSGHASDVWNWDKQFYRTISTPSKRHTQSATIVRTIAAALRKSVLP